MRIRESVLLSVRLALVAAALHAPLPALAGPVQLATSPLTNATTSNVLPNLMFILDNSGSMAWDFTPDYISETSGTPKATDKQCRDSGDDDNGVAYSGAMNGNTRVLDLCAVGDVPFMTSSMNRQYYNPAIRYRPGVNFRGESLASQTDPTKVQTDPYGKQRTNQLLQSKTLVDLTTEYPDRVWCTKNDPTDAELNNPSVCRRNSGYLYPDATYRYGRRKDTGGPDQRVTQTMLNGVLKVQGAPYYYSVVPSEYCDAADLRNCVAASAPTGNYTFPAHSRWCTDAMLTNCQAVRTASYTFPRYIGSPGATATAAVGTLRVRESRNLNVTSIRVNNVEILGSTVAWGNSNSNSGFAAAIAAQINTYTSNPNYTATVSGDTITLSSTVAAGAAGNGPISLSGTLSNYTLSSGGMTGGKDAINALAPYTFARTNIVPSVNSYPKAGGRTDCAGTTCTYAEEITNFANWYAYYRTRMQMMKTSATLAFKGIGDNFRVGFITISSQTTTGHYLPIDRFSSGAAGANSQKERWYSTLLNINPSGGTPLRSALSIVGRIYAGQKPVGNSDPVQYSCQQNFALLTSDGYWNTDTNSVVRGLDGNPVGNLDSDPSTRPVYEGPTATANTLADVAKYFYDTDLRDPKWGNCTGALGEGIDVCENNVFTTSTDLNTKQHMTTFTLGLGIDGTLNYTDDYMTATSGDFYRLKTGTGSPVVNWPIPVADTETAVDDLWHAAVNGGGIYFNAQDPTQLAKGLEGALASIGAKIGAGAAAATSTLNPVPGDNFAYVASYTTQKWHGNLEARSINLLTGVVSESAAWCVESVIAESCSGTVVSEDTGSSRAFYCVRQNVAEESCEGQFDGSSCKVQMATACTGTMSAKVSASGDTRKILMKGSSGALVPFLYDNMAAAQKAFFTGAGLSQRATLSDAQRTAASGANLVNYLRGQTGLEDRSSNPANNRLFRYREATLGDAIESEPAFDGKATFSYLDAGYSAFAEAKANRGRTVYVGANDGMLHAFDAQTGIERWAYVPSMVMHNMWRLADINYASNHINFVNGAPFIGDVYHNGSWRTILVAGLNGGGRGYYALDVTDPDSPTLLWEIDQTTESNLGFSFAKPVITKLNDGTWVVLFTSGYNNISPGDGKGYLYVRNAVTGAHIRRIATNVGSTDNPSGLGKIASWADKPEKNNLTTFTYGGDLQGNLWRFDINAGTATRMAILRDAAGAVQPITARPELGAVSGRRIIFVGTGKYLELSDLEDAQTQTLYAIRDDLSAGTLDNPRTALVEQTLTTTGATRKVSSNAIDLRRDRGWYIDFPDSGERVNVDIRLDSGTLIVPTTVPSATVCEPGGYGWLNYFNYLTGSVVPGAEDGLSGQRYNAPIVGVNTYRLPNGKRIVTAVTANNPTPEKPPKGTGGDLPDAGFRGKRVIYREISP